MDDDVVLYELGVDLNSSLAFHDGDIVLSKYDDNLVQSVANRLNTELDELDLFYEDYGSILLTFLGWKANDTTIGFIESELETVLKNEERLTSWEYNVEYTGNGVLRIDLTLYPNADYSINVSLNLDDNGVSVIEEEE